MLHVPPSEGAHDHRDAAPARFPSCTGFAALRGIERGKKGMKIKERGGGEGAKHRAASMTARAESGLLHGSRRQVV